MSKLIKTYPVGDEIIDIQKSKGGINKYCHYCDVTTSNALYAICLNTVDAIVERDMDLKWDDCVHAIKSGECPAMAMRKEEEAAGKALYFTPWIFKEELPKELVKRELKPVDKTSDSYLRGRYGRNYKRMDIVGIKKTEHKYSSPRKKPKTKELSEEEPMNMNMGELVSVIAKEEKEKSISKARLPNETPLAYAKRMKELRQAS